MPQWAYQPFRPPVYEEQSVDGTAYVWWQTHVRGWDTDGRGVEVHGHRELEPAENGNAPIDGVGFVEERGTANLRAVLDGAGINFVENTFETETRA